MTPVRILIPLTIYNFMYEYFPYMSSSYDTGSYFNRILIPLIIILGSFHSILTRAYILMRLKILHQTTFQPNVNHTNTSYSTDNNSTAVTVTHLKILGPILEATPPSFIILHSEVQGRMNEPLVLICRYTKLAS